MRIIFFTVDTLKRTFELVRKSGAFCTGNALKNKKGQFEITGSLCNPDNFGYNLVQFVGFMVASVIVSSSLGDMRSCHTCPCS